MNLRPWLQLIRAPAVFTAVSNIVAAHLVIGNGRIDPMALLPLVLASGLLYCGGMALNDCFDYAEDLRERPGRPLPAGQISRRAGWIFAGVLMTLGVLAAAAVSPRALAVSLALATLVVVYDGVLKNTALAPLIMGGCRAFNWLLGLSFAAFVVTDAWLALPIFFYVTGLTTLSRVETTAASKVPVAVCAATVGLTLAAMAALIQVGALDRPWALLPAAGAAGYLLLRLGRLWGNFEAKEIQRTMTLLIVGIIPLDALMVLAGGPWWGAIAVLLLMVPGRFVARSVYIT